MALFAVVIITASMVALLVAELMAAGLIGTRLLGVDASVATLAAACAVLACFVVRGAGGSSTMSGVLYLLLLAALLVPLMLVSAQWYGLPVPQIAYVNSLWQLQGIEENLLEQELADNAWLTVPADMAIVFDLPPEERLAAAMQKLGFDFTNLSDTAGHA